MSSKEDHISIATASKALGQSKQFVLRAIEKGYLRTKRVPFRSNLEPGGKTVERILVHPQDVRDAITGVIDLSLLNEVQRVTRKALPEDLTELAEHVMMLTQTAEQTAVMVSRILEHCEAQPIVKKGVKP